VLLALCAGLAVSVHGDTTPLAFDPRLETIATRLTGPLPVGRLDGVDGRWWLLAAVVAVAGLLWWADRREDRRLAKAVVVAPLATVLLGQLVLRPAVGRNVGTMFGFPSGPASVAASLAVLAVVVAGWPPPRAVPRPVGASSAGPAAPATAGSGRGRLGTVLVGLAASSAALGVAVVVAAGAVVATDSLAGLLLGAGVTLVVVAGCRRLLPAHRPLFARTWVRSGAALALGACGALIGAIRLPYFELSPGSLIPLNTAISVADPEAAASTELHGIYSGLTVRSTTLTIGSWTWHTVRGSDNPIVGRAAVVPAGQDNERWRQIERQRFVDASAVAVAVAERELGKPVVALGDGAAVTGVDPAGPSAGLLTEGDVIVEVGGRAVATEDQLREALIAVTAAAGVDPAPAPADDGVTVPAALVVRDLDGTTRTVTVPMRRLARSGRVGLGIGVATANLRFELPVAMTVDGGRVGGPSAGLLTALAAYDVLAAEDLAAGRHIAGTGTLSWQGVVGRIGGIEEKVRAAVDADADVFLAPADQLAEAEAAARGRIEVVGVATFGEALRALRDA